MNDDSMGLFCTKCGDNLLMHTDYLISYLLKKVESLEEKVENHRHRQLGGGVKL